MKFKSKRRGHKYHIKMRIVGGISLQFVFPNLYEVYVIPNLYTSFSLDNKRPVTIDIHSEKNNCMEVNGCWFPKLSQISSFVFIKRKKQICFDKVKNE